MNSCWMFLCAVLLFALVNADDGQAMKREELKARLFEKAGELLKQKRGQHMPMHRAAKSNAGYVHRSEPETEIREIPGYMLDMWRMKLMEHESESGSGSGSGSGDM